MKDWTERVATSRRSKSAYVYLDQELFDWIDNVMIPSARPAMFVGNCIWLGYQIFHSDRAKWIMWLMENCDNKKFASYDQHRVSGDGVMFDSIGSLVLPGQRQGFSGSARTMLRILKHQTEL